MTVSSINMAMSASSWGAYNQKLTQATRAKLEELNIPYNSNTTEEQARAMINQKLAQKSSDTNKDKNNKDFSQKNPLYEQAKELAKKLNIEFDEKTTSLTSLLSTIESAISSKINANKDNMAVLKELRKFGEELANIQAQNNGSSGYDATNKALMLSLELLGEYNKNFLNK